MALLFQDITDQDEHQFWEKKVEDLVLVRFCIRSDYWVLSLIQPAGGDEGEIVPLIRGNGTSDRHRAVEGFVERVERLIHRRFQYGERIMSAEGWKAVKDDNGGREVKFKMDNDEE